MFDNKFKKSTFFGMESGFLERNSTTKSKHSKSIRLPHNYATREQCATHRNERTLTLISYYKIDKNHIKNKKRRINAFGSSPQSNFGIFHVMQINKDYNESETNLNIFRFYF